jgi:hypothetical protein
MSDIFGEPTSTIRIDLTQNLSALSTSPTVHLTVKARRFELSKLNCDKFNNNCILKEYMLACKNFDLIKKNTHTHTHKSVCALDATRIISMATERNRFSVV